MKLQAVYLFLIISAIIGCKLEVDSKSENKMVITTTDEYVSSKKLDTAKVAISQAVLKSSTPAIDSLDTVKKAVAGKKKESVVPKTTVTQKPKKAKKTPKKKTALQKKKKEVASFSWQSDEFNFGEITEGDIIEHTFKFTNTGKAPLDIVSVTPSCGCTQPSYPFLSIDPGVSNEIGVTYNSVSKEGDQVATVTIVANTDPKTTVLRLIGTVNPKPKEEKMTESDTIITSKENVTEEEKTEKKVKKIMKDASTKIVIKKDDK